MTVTLDIQMRRHGFSLNAKLNAPAGVSVIFGPSGSGKTTLLRAVAGLDPVDQGHIAIDHVDMAGVAPHRRAVGYVFQEPRLLPHLTVLGNLKFAQKMGRVVADKASTTSRICWNCAPYYNAIPWRYRVVKPSELPWVVHC